LRPSLQIGGVGARARNADETHIAFLARHRLMTSILYLQQIQNGRPFFTLIMHWTILFSAFQLRASDIIWQIAAVAYRMRFV
jgi:hypothetical protein